MTGHPSDTTVDPRPLHGEPLALDLLNTHWLQDGALQDLLADRRGLGIWLRSAAVAPTLVSTSGTDTLVAVRSARDIIQAVAERPGDDPARRDFNALLARGRRVRSLSQTGPRTVVEVDDGAWTVPWLAAENYLDLLERAPERIRSCEHPQCVLWYFDTSRAGTRRWCSMSICGNRTKATRHYRRRTVTE